MAEVTKGERQPARTTRESMKQWPDIRRRWRPSMEPLHG